MAEQKEIDPRVVGSVQIAEQRATAASNEATPAFTPGPWRDVDGVVVAEALDAIVMVAQKDGTMAPHHTGLLALVYGHHVGDDSVYTLNGNRRLIAAAPDLYAALKDARALALRGLHWYQQKFTENPSSENAGHEDGLIATMETIDAALAKAEGK